MRDFVARRLCAGVLTRNFLHKALAFISRARVTRFLVMFYSMASTIFVVSQISNAQESLILREFLKTRRNDCGACADLHKRALTRLSGAPAHARYGSRARTSTLDPAKMLVFLPRCSNANAVFAIPAGTTRHRHSLRLGGQHGEEAKVEDEVGGEEGRS